MAHRVESERVLPWSSFAWRTAALDRAVPQAGGLLVAIPPGAGAASSLVRLWRLASQLPTSAELVLYGDAPDLAALLGRTPPGLEYHLWAVVRTEPVSRGGRFPAEHRSLLLLGREANRFRHARVRVGYTYCPACNRTTKDYGGRKHLYDAYGTLVSDVWKDEVAGADDPLPCWVVDRVAGLLATPDRGPLVVTRLVETPADARFAASFLTRDGQQPSEPETDSAPAASAVAWRHESGELWSGDCLALLPRVPTGSIDLAFADPPYNLAKSYRDSRDRHSAADYLGWCERWLAEYCRVLRPGGVLAVLNLPHWAAAHLRLLDRQLAYLNWIAWESMSLPARAIMPSHYALLLFRKPGARAAIEERSSRLTALRHGFCLRAACIRRRDPALSTGPVTDLWCDVHRIKHNSRRGDHPCQLPPRLIERLIVSTTDPNDRVLDAFNGIGTTTLVARQLGRQFLGIELSQAYGEIARERHLGLEAGTDPFAARTGAPEVKNNRVPRQPARLWPVPKMAIQLAVRQLATELGRMPTREEAVAALPYPAEVYGLCFKSWSEVLAAARTTGMRDRREE